MQKHLKLFKANVPGDGNCAITSTMAHINEIKNTNFSVHGKTVLSFQKWFVNELMKVICDPNIYEYLNVPEVRLQLLAMIKDEPYRFWWNDE